MKQTAFAPGKIILSGEYAVVFDYPGIAVPASVGMRVTWEEQLKKRTLVLKWTGIKGGKEWETYARKIVDLLVEDGKPFHGTLTVKNDLPLQKGMGSSTALVISLARALLGPGKRTEALAVENAVNPGNSGLDFAVIWEQKPLLFQHGKEPTVVDIPTPLTGAILIDTGKPDQATPELVAWVRSRKDEPAIAEALETIGHCTERLLEGEDFRAVCRAHHRAQCTLGVVPHAVQTLIQRIEGLGGSAKVIGAGGTSGGGGMVLAVGIGQRALEKIAAPFSMLEL